MKKLIATAALAGLSLTAQASPLSGVLAANIGYLSSNTSITLAVNLDKGQAVGFTPASDNVRAFCGIVDLYDGGILTAGYGITFFVAPRDSFYLVTCIKSSSSFFSGNVISFVADASYFGVSSRSSEFIDVDDFEALQAEVDLFLK